MTDILPMNSAKRPVHLSAHALTKTYTKGAHKFPVLRGVDFSIARGEFVSIIGQSGSGKSTLLHLLGLLDTPAMGEVRLESERIDDLHPSSRDELRNRIFGFVFQFYHLLPELTLLENVMMPYMIRTRFWDYWRRKREFKTVAEEMLAKVGLEHRMKHRPSELSGGQRRRVAIARAMAAKPGILLYDEATTGLDPITATTIDEEIVKLRDLEGVSSIIVTHQLRDAFFVAEHEAIRAPRGFRIERADAAKADEAEFIMLRDGVIAFEGNAAELRASNDDYIRTFLS